MLNAVSKISIIASLALAVCSCGSSEREQARQLSDAAETELKAGNYEAAVNILDTLDTRYASQVEVRRSAMKFRAMAVEGLTLRRITVVDDTLSILDRDLQACEGKFEYKVNPGKGLGGNLVMKSIAGKKPALLPRINDDGYFTLSVTVTGKPIGFQYVRFGKGADSATTEPVDAGRLVKVEGSEMTVLQQEDVATAIEWLKNHQDTKQCELVGTKGQTAVRLTPELVGAIVSTFDYAQLRQAKRQALIEREKLERKLKLCRDQLANLIDK